MSRILSKNRIIAIFMAVILVVAEVLVALTTRHYIPFIVLDLIAIIALLLNRRVKNIMYAQRFPFSATSKIRNVDCLVIGEICNIKDVIPTKCDTYVQIKLPCSSIDSCFEVLKHTSSMIKERGSVVLVYSQLDKGNHFSVLDTYFLHEITIKKYGIKLLGAKYLFPVLFNPIASLKLLANQIVKDLKITGAKNEISAFCKEREYELYVYCTKLSC